MALGDARLRSERIRTPGDLLVDDPEACHVYAWLFEHGPATLEEYVETVDVNDHQARLAATRLQVHDRLVECEDGLAAEPVHETVDGVHVTPGVAAVLAVQLENYNVRRFVRRHGPLALAEAAACWPLVEQGALESRRVGDAIGVDQQDGVTATNALRAVADYLADDPYLDEIPAPDVATAVPIE